jgi:hypothetical protein
MEFEKDAFRTRVDPNDSSVQFDERVLSSSMVSDETRDA